MRVDYIRLYQDPDDATHTLSCSPPSHPTAEFIAQHAGEYRTLQSRAAIGAANDAVAMHRTLPRLEGRTRTCETRDRSVGPTGEDPKFPLHVVLRSRTR
jgi:hypothetical protein